MTDIAEVREMIAEAFVLGCTGGGWTDADEFVASRRRHIEEDDEAIADAILKEHGYEVTND